MTDSTETVTKGQLHVSRCKITFRITDKSYYFKIAWWVNQI